VEAAECDHFGTETNKLTKWKILLIVFSSILVFVFGCYYSKIYLIINIFGDTLKNFGDTQMCCDTQFEKHCPRGT
jgi:hypothetical protein